MISSAHISFQLTTLQSQNLLPAFDQAAHATGIDRNLLLAIASRESNMGRALDANYLGDNGNGMGLMQIDRRYHPHIAATVHPGDHPRNVLEGAKIFRDKLNRLGGNTYNALAAYNAGVGRVRQALAANADPDTRTTGGNYAKDVLQRKEMIDAALGTGNGPPSLAPLLASMQTFTGLLLLSALAGTAYLLFLESE